MELCPDFAQEAQVLKGEAMTGKSKVQVVIGGKVLTMGGYEDEVHIQRIASIVNRTIQELEETDAYRCLPADLKPVLVETNIADELVKAEDYAKQLEADLRLKEDELAEVKHDLIEAQMKLEKYEGKKNGRK